MKEELGTELLGRAQTVIMVCLYSTCLVCVEEGWGGIWEVGRLKLGWGDCTLVEFVSGDDGRSRLEPWEKGTRTNLCFR